VENAGPDGGAAPSPTTSRSAGPIPIPHGDLVGCVAHLTNDLASWSVITGAEKGAIQSCAAQAEAPRAMAGYVKDGLSLTPNLAQTGTAFLRIDRDAAYRDDQITFAQPRFFALATRKQLLSSRRRLLDRWTGGLLDLAVCRHQRGLVSGDSLSGFLYPHQ
jgi:hypothetical protein